MKLVVFRQFMVCLFLLCAGVPSFAPVFANESALTEYAERLAALETELNHVKSNLGDGDGFSDSDDCDDCCSRTLYTGFEVPFLKVHNSGLVIPAVGFTTPTFDYDPGIRLWAGREWSNGLGGRITYFDFEDAATSVVAGVPLNAGVDIYTFDFELTQRGHFCNWDFLLSGGLRVGGLEQNFAAAALGGVAVLRDFDGAGLTMALGFNRPVGTTNLSLYGNFRGSVLFGDADVTGNLFGVPFVAQIPNETISVLEMQLGVEYRREMAFGVGFLRTALEAQTWEQPPVLLGVGDANIGLFGPTIAFGLER